MTNILQITPDITSFGVAFKRIGLIPFGGRSTAIRLRDQSVLLTASHPLDEPTKQELKRLGEIQYLVALDSEHSMYLTDYSKAYPKAKLIGVLPHLKKHPDLQFSGIFGRDAEPFGEIQRTGEIKCEYFDSHPNKDFVLFHADSKTLVEADLLFNLPAREQSSKTTNNVSGFWPLSILIRKMQPFDPFHQTYCNLIATDKKAMTASAKIVASWDFTRIIPCHGDILESNGKEAWTTAYKRFLAMDS